MVLAAAPWSAISWYCDDLEWPTQPLQKQIGSWPGNRPGLTPFQGEGVGGLYMKDAFAILSLGMHIAQHSASLMC